VDKGWFRAGDYLIMTTVPQVGDRGNPQAGSLPARSAADEVRELYRSGRLAAQYPAVQRLIADVADEELASVGQLLSRVDPADVQARHPSVTTVTAAVTGHGTLSELIPLLTAELARHGLLLRPLVSDFDSYVFDLSDPDSALYAADPDLILCVLDPTVIFETLTAPWLPADVERVASEKIRVIEKLVSRYESAGRGTLVLNTMPMLRRFAAQLVDYRSRARLGAVWHEANARLLRLAERHPQVVVLDIDPHLADGIAASDARLSIYAKAHLSAGLLTRYAREVGHLVRHLVGRTKKVLVLDLDGTMWGGVLAEDGPAAIEVGGCYRGEAFRAFQRVLKQLQSQGVLLAVVSKNDLAPVRTVLRDHPEMILREDDFVRVIANWRPKHDNLADLAGELNLGVDSFVFADDSAFECGLIRHALPGVAVVRLDDEPARHIERLLRDGWFDVLEVTAEDHARVTRYREELARKDFLATFDSLVDYLRELEVSVRLTVTAREEVPRVAQLTLRTNQFNLTTQRLQPADVSSLIGDPAALVLSIHASDRFGDNGLVGAIFTRREGDIVTIDNFVLSCRVFSRNIEQACLVAVLRHAGDTGACAVLGSYRMSPKNGNVKNLYPGNGFVPVLDDGTTVTFRHDLREIPAPPEHIRVAVDFGGGTL
jgi:FkbH-like protein